MSRPQQQPIKRKEVIYRRSFIDNGINDFNNRIDNEFNKSKRGDKPIVYQNNIYYPEKLDDVDRKLDAILNALNPRKSPDYRSSKVHESDLDRMRDIVDRLEKMENTQRKNSFAGAADVDYSDIRKQIDDLSMKQKKLSETVKKVTNRSSENVDDILTVVNDTRCDLEEKIDTVRHFNEENHKNLNDKIGSLQYQQEQIQIQMNELMQILTSLSSSRSSSINEKKIDESLGKGSVEIQVVNNSTKGSNASIYKERAVDAQMQKPLRLHQHQLKKTKELDEASQKSRSSKRLSVTSQHSEQTLVKHIPLSELERIKEKTPEATKVPTRASSIQSLKPPPSPKSVAKSVTSEDRRSARSLKNGHVSEKNSVASAPVTLERTPDILEKNLSKENLLSKSTVLPEDTPVLGSRRSSEHYVREKRETPVDVPANVPVIVEENLHRELELNSIRGSPKIRSRHPSRVSVETDISKYFAEERAKSVGSVIEETSIHLTPLESEIVSGQRRGSKGSSRKASGDTLKSRQSQENILALSKSPEENAASRKGSEDKPITKTTAEDKLEHSKSPEDMARKSPQHQGPSRKTSEDKLGSSKGPEDKQGERLWTMVVTCYDPHWHNLCLELTNRNGVIEQKLSKQGSDEFLPALQVETRRQSQPALFQTRV